MPLLLLIINNAARLTINDVAMVAVFIVSSLCIITGVLVYWKQSMTRWQVWAYSRVESVHELQQAAALAGIINGYIAVSDLQKRYPNAYQSIQHRLNNLWSQWKMLPCL